MAYVKGLDLEKLICEVIFQGVTVNLPSSFYLGIGYGPLPVKDALLSAIAEQSGPGYSRIQLQRNTTDFPTLALAGSDWKVSSLLKRWTASGAWAHPCDFIFLTDVSAGTAGRFFGAVSIPNPFTPAVSGETFDDLFEYQDK